MVTLKQLRYLVALSTHGHFGKAAQAVAISQPALSMQIRDLEQELDVVLVERGKGDVWLTPEGKEIVQRADAILAQVRDLSECANSSHAILSGTLKLGVIPSIAPYTQFPAPEDGRHLYTFYLHGGLNAQIAALAKRASR